MNATQDSGYKRIIHFLTSLIKKHKADQPIANPHYLAGTDPVPHAA